MKRQFHINNYFIEVDKNQITNTECDTQDALVNVPPKSLEVLLVLIENTPSVVSVETIMDKVWGNTVVSPNSVQRCIAQLRKAMGDNSKLQTIIKTHAKKGYSLEANVRLAKEPQENSNTEERKQPLINRAGSSSTFEASNIQHEKSNASENLQNSDKTTINERISPTVLNKTEQLKENKSRWHQRLINLKAIIIILIVFMLVISSFHLLPSSTRNLELNSLTPILVSDAKETNASYSPDGNAIVFHRFDGFCANNIWLYDLTDNQEHQLTLSTGFYGSHQFTPDGKKLAFMAKETCSSTNAANKDITNTDHDIVLRQCWNLMTLDIEQALTSAMEPEVAVSCHDGELSNPVWLDNGNIAVLKKKNDRWHVVKYMPDATIEKTLYAPGKLNIYHLGHLPENNELYVIGINDKSEHLLQRIDTQGNVITSHPIERKDGLLPYRLIYPFEDPFTHQLAFTTGKRLFSLSFDGKVSKLSQLPYNDLSRHSFHPDGRSIIATQGKVDLDISKTSFDALASKLEPEFNQLAHFNAVHQPYKSLTRSAHAEFDAHFQPNGELIAFISDRSGQEQIWLKRGQQISQLTQFPTDTVIESFAWSPQGNSLIAAVNGQLIEIDIDKTQQVIDLPYPITEVYQWLSDDNLLLKVRIQGVLKVATYNIATKDLTPLTTTQVKWAQISDTAGLIYQDEFNQYWQQSDSGAVHLATLNNQSASTRFILRADNIWSFNQDYRLWQYHIKQQTLDFIGHVSSQIAYFSDVKGEQLLLTQIISARKDIVKLKHTPLVE
ncbi:hypothetical protein tinsulaeT_29720 [Thalassotalea insulae]|uniref:OmpR/PhoB-type domain-containing protein n=1 Tax=Thalassotalea insulae TaxID=2056778 RepID=A0ABQ6GUR6_9GAMM|nr:winged helix-turn-helix domain-containing protein [Thalassotalea insulae]GLX79632.1 hypothetical protein tinsulaeT_29720 [Thalassotalea insulae]